MTSRKFIIILLCCCMGYSSFSQLKQPIVYKSINEIPAYLKLVKPVAKNADKKEFAIKPSSSLTKLPANFRIVSRKTAVTGFKVALPDVYAPGMNEEFSIHANRFADDGTQMILLGHNPTQTPRGVYVVKIREEFKNLLTAPINLEANNRTALQLGWKVKLNSDGSFYLSTRAWPQRLGVDAAGKIKMLPETESHKTKWIAYQNGWCSNTPIWLYNPYSRSFLGRSMVGDAVNFVVVRADDALNGRVPKTIKLDWDFATGKTYGSLYGPQGNSFYTYLSRVPTDRDRDGSEASQCGGTDCNDADEGVWPGNLEIDNYQNPGKDEDCDPLTFGSIDRDGDGYFDNTYFNTSSDGSRHGGTDCDDSNPAIIPGAVKYISDTQVEVCGLGVFNVEAGMRAVRQPNGTAIVVPK